MLSHKIHLYITASKVAW